MTGTVWKLAVALASGIGIAGATTAYAAEATEVAVMSHASVAPSITQSANSLAPTTVLAAGQRVTNLQKSATFISVSGIDSDRRHRSTR